MLGNWIKNQNTHSPKVVFVSKIQKLLAIPIWLLDRDFLLNRRLLGMIIRKTILKKRPEVVHLLETQGAGYAYARADIPNADHHTVLTLFGSDLNWFRHFPLHKSRLEDLMPRVDYLSTECSRDAELARELGFKGKLLTQAPVSGGLKMAEILNDYEAANPRKFIALKGYAGTWGLAHEAIKTISQNADLFQDRTLVVYSASSKVSRACRKLLTPQGVKYRLHRKHSLSHAELLEIFKNSLIHIGLSKSDGLPASMLEAMSQGAFPVQTSSACIEGWFKNGFSGIAIDRLAELDVALEKLNSGSVDFYAARLSNLETIRAKYSSDNLSQQETFRIYLDLTKK